MRLNKQIEMFMESMVKKDSEAKKEYLAKLVRIRKGNFVNVSNFTGQYTLIQ